MLKMADNAYELVKNLKKKSKVLGQPSFLLSHKKKLKMLQCETGTSKLSEV